MFTSHELVRDMKEIHAGEGVVITWPEAVKEELADGDHKEHERKLEARLNRPIEDVIVVGCQHDA